MTHEFILASEIPSVILFSDFERDKMTVIDDDFILQHYIPIRKVKMHCSYLGNIIDGLAYHGNTILDVDMSIALRNELLPIATESAECRKLIGILSEAIEQNKYVIHFGI